MRFLFFVFGVPMMIMSFFQAIDALPFVQDTNVCIDGQEIILTEEQKVELGSQIESLFEGSHTLPSLAVMFENDFQEKTKEGTFVYLKFDRQYCINDLLFDELVFEVIPDYQGFNLYRGNNGIYQGRCIYIDLINKNMQPLYDYIQTLGNQTEDFSKKENVEIKTDLIDKNMQDETI